MASTTAPRAAYRPRHARPKRRRTFPKNRGLIALAAVLATALGGYASLAATTAAQCPLP